MLRDALGVPAEAMAGNLDPDDDGIVRQAIEPRGCDDGVAEDLSPSGEASVRGQA